MARSLSQSSDEIASVISAPSATFVARAPREIPPWLITLAKGLGYATLAGAVAAVIAVPMVHAADVPVGPSAMLGGAIGAVCAVGFWCYRDAKQSREQGNV
jgi:hypothetical protein